MNKQLSKWGLLHFIYRRKEIHHILWWLGAIFIGFIAYILARIGVVGLNFFLHQTEQYFWWPFLILPLAIIFLTWFMRKIGAGTEGSGIQQAVAAVQVAESPAKIHYLVNIKLAIAKFFAIVVGLCSGFIVGLEGPTVQIGASIMYTFRRFLPFDNAIARRQLVIMGGAAGIAAAFNAPMAGVMFALEEMWRSLESKTAARIVLAIVLAGVTAQYFSGEASYFGKIPLAAGFDPKFIPTAIMVIILGGLIGGLFSWLVIRANRWLPKPVLTFKAQHPYYFGIVCALLIACCGVFAPIFGSGAELTSQMLYGETTVAWYYMPLKFIAFLLTSLTGIPGGIFSPSVSLGAGLGSWFTVFVSPEWHSQVLAVGMIAVLSAVTRAPLTSAFIIIEMTQGHSMVFVAFVAAIFSSNIARIFHVRFYHDLASSILKSMPTNLK